MEWNILTSFIDKNKIDPGKIHHEQKMRNIRSNYDNLSLKIKIEQYEYVFSRFNLSRYLMACQIPPSIAVDIARVIKEEFVDKQVFLVNQEDFTKRVIEMIAKVDPSDTFQRRFRLIQHFYLERMPLIIFISGTGFIGKSSTAFQLGERLNISTILQTDIVKALISGSGDHLNQELWYREHKSITDCMNVYNTASDIVQKGIEGDIVKTLADGKPLIIEGVHLDPFKYLKICGKRSLLPLEGFPEGVIAEISPGRMGFIIPILLTKPQVLIQTSVLSAVNGSSKKKIHNFSVSKIVNYAIAIQKALISRFPKQYIIDASNNDVIDQIHNIFLGMIEQYYGKMI